ncbi:SCO2322 family protein [Streptomyces hesseae]|uniref:SCO2322 family protein n=1 Tax=Streptomyces hesseae TaxID=3075519 RepID=A0ABU2SY90_9ACTN|nr:SCO2322 family protein [Streptomyces sp. DSM 40473]MDT0453968.1 SCO2322 family protein [Streptomyces sp. DSM 40473]
MTAGRARGLFVSLLVGAAAVLGAAPAHAEGYRYWSFWQTASASASGKDWTYATQGPATLRPADGSVIGFRFAVSKDSADAAKPRGAADFAAVCAGTPAEDGGKRVAVVLDFGTPGDAPAGETPPATRSACAKVGADGSAADVLAAVAKPLRYDSSALLCAIAGYPRSGCGEKVGAGKPAESKASEKSDSASEKGDGGPSAGLIGGIAAVAALGAAAAWQTRRRRRG